MPKPTITPTIHTLPANIDNVHVHAPPLTPPPSTPEALSSSFASSFSSASPPRSAQVEAILSYLQRYNVASVKDPSASTPPVRSVVDFPLSAAGYQQLLAIVQADEDLSFLWEHKIRFDYFYTISRFTLRMVTVTHETFRSRVRGAIEEQLRRIGTGTDKAAEYAQKIKPEGSPRLAFKAADETKENLHEPDEVFAYPNTKYPVAILEIAYSQKRAALKYLADNYILGSEANVRLLIGIKLDYEPPPSTNANKAKKLQSKKASFSIWRPELVEEDGQSVLVAECCVEDCVFRSKEGKFLDGPGIQLTLQDFATSALFDGETDSLTQPISISAATLFEFLETAEGRNNTAQGSGGVQQELPSGIRKRWRVHTPEDEDSYNDSDSDERPAKRAMARSDTAYRP